MSKKHIWLYSVVVIAFLMVVVISRVTNAYFVTKMNVASLRMSELGAPDSLDCAAVAAMRQLNMYADELRLQCARAFPEIT